MRGQLFVAKVARYPLSETSAAPISLRHSSSTVTLIFFGISPLDKCLYRRTQELSSARWGAALKVRALLFALRRFHVFCR